MASDLAKQAWESALWVQQETGLNAEFVIRQWAHESANFTSRLARENNNLGGVTQTTPNGDENKQPDGTCWYCVFSNVKEYASYYVNSVINHYEGKEEAKTLEGFVHFLKTNGYFGDSEENYLNGLKGVSLDGIVEPTVKNTHGEKIIASAKQHLGHAYEDQSCCFRCTGFVYQAYKGAGIDFETQSGLSGNYMMVPDFIKWAKASGNFSTDKSCMIAGDIIFGNNEGHVAIYMGDENIIHNSSSQGKVITDSGAWMIDADSFNGFLRIGSDVPITTKAYTVIGSNGTKYSGLIGSLFSAGGNANSGFSERQRGSEWIIHMNKLDKTRAEPVYPDYITITNNIPGYLYDNKELTNATVTATIKLDNMTQSVINTEKLASKLGISSDFIDTLSDYRKRQMTFDATKHRNTVKSPNAGSPKNPTDPYPVDSKIEELELHMKRVKLKEIKLTKPERPDKQLAKFIIEVSDAAEKRITKLENILATVTRYLFALGSRIQINCQYYGGQDRFQKYTCIRCLKDDLISDGQVVQLDQCLTCDRYEPVIGQVYDIVNEAGFNLAAIQDDMQSSLMSMNQYVQLTKVNEVTSKLTEAQLPTTKLLEKEKDDLLFAEDSNRWKDGNGLTMNWDLVPVEEQKAQINWMQNINDTTDAKRVASYQMDPKNLQDNMQNANNGVSVGISAGAMRSFFEKSYANITTNKTMRAAFSEEMYQTQAAKVETAAGNMRTYDYSEKLVKAAGEAGLDPLFIFSVITRESDGVPNNIGQVTGSTGSESIEEQFKSMCSVMKSKFDDSNWKSYCTKIQAYNSLIADDFFTSYNADEYNYSYYEHMIEYTSDATNKAIIMEYVPAIVFTYIAALKNDELMKSLKSSMIYKEGELAVPYEKANFGKVYFTSPWGWRESTSSNHAGWDFSSGEHLPILAAADGKCVIHRENESGYGNYIVIEHRTGLQTLYGHMKEPSPFKEGDTVKQGDIVGYEGNTGGNYPVHLHFGVYTNFSGGNGDYGNSADPLGFFPQFNGQKGQALSTFLK